jgi:hypothetical protein
MPKKTTHAKAPAPTGDTAATYLRIVGESHGPLSPAEVRACEAWDAMSEAQRQAMPYLGNPAEYIVASVRAMEGQPSHDVDPQSTQEGEADPQPVR